MTQEEPYFVGALDEVLEQGTPVSIETDALLRTAHHYFEEYCKMSGRISGETMQSVLLEIEDPGQLADIIAANVLSKIEDRQQVLEEFDELARLESVCALLVRETELAGVEKKVQARVRKQIEQNQKDYFCGSRSRRFRTELGDKDATDVEDLRERLAKTPMNDEARDKANRELERAAWRPAARKSGSAEPISNGCSICRGARPRRITSISSVRAGFWRRITTGWTR